MMPGLLLSISFWFFFAALYCATNEGSARELAIWSVLCAVFGGLAWHVIQRRLHAEADE